MHMQAQVAQNGQIYAVNEYIASIGLHSDFVVDKSHFICDVSKIC